jgi:uncharacterized protein YhaN
VDTIPIAARPLRVIVEMALEIQRRHENNATARNGLEAGFKKATTETGRKRKALEAADAELKAWQAQWTAAVQCLRLNAAATPETLDAQINAIDELREVANRINDLRHERIDKIERDIPRSRPKYPRWSAPSNRSWRIRTRRTRFWNWNAGWHLRKRPVTLPRPLTASSRMLAKKRNNTWKCSARLARISRACNAQLLLVRSTS